MKFYIFILILFLGSGFAQAQDKQADGKDKEKNVYKKKSVVKEVKALYKAANFAKADETIRNAFKKYPEANNDPDLLGSEVNIQYQLYLAENRKLFLDTKGDTAKFFGYIYNTYDYGLKCDSVCRIPDKKGKTNNRYTSVINNYLSSLRGNLKSGALFFMKKQSYRDAFRFFDMYIGTMNNPLAFKNKSGVVVADSDSVRIYQMALHAAYGAEKFQDVLRYYDVAVSDSSRRELVMEMGAKSAIQIPDSNMYLSIMESAFDEFPSNEFFSAGLIKLYHESRQFDKTMDVIDKCISLDSLNVKYWKLKGNEFYDVDSVKQATDAYEHVVAIDSTDLEAYLRLGRIYIANARDFYENADLSLTSPDVTKNKERLDALYTDVMVCFERVRALSPNIPALWKSPLLEAYYRLNKGKELKELEKVR